MCTDPALPHRRANRPPRRAGLVPRPRRIEVEVFLVTDEGGREATADLDFERGTWQRSARKNYRFDALSSVHVEIENMRRYTLNITLTNGPTRKIPVYGNSTHDTVDEPRHEVTLDINLDAAVFSHTLRILEGIAAEGKPWFDREPGTPPPPEPDPPSGPMDPVVLPTGAGEPSLH